MKKQKIITVSFFLFLALFPLVLIILKSDSLLTSPLYPYSDPATNSLLIAQAKRLELLTGNYSRIGFYHPGPFFLYWQALFEVLLFDLTHLVPGAYNADLLSAVVYCGLCLALSGHWLSKELDLRPIPRMAVSSVLLFTFLRLYLMLSGGNFTWPPFFYFMSFLPFVILLGLCLMGNMKYLPWFCLFASILVHGHICFTLFAVVGSLLILARQYWTHRRAFRPWLRDNRVPLLLSLGVLFLFILPIAIYTIRFFPGEIPYYFSYAGESMKQPRTLLQSLDFVLQFFTPLGLWLVLLLLTGLVVVTARFLRASPSKLHPPKVHPSKIRPAKAPPRDAKPDGPQMALRCLLLAIGVTVALSWFYVYFQVDAVEEQARYTCYFVYSDFILLCALVVASLLSPLSFKIQRALGTGMCAVFAVILLMQPVQSSDQGEVPDRSEKILGFLEEIDPNYAQKPLHLVSRSLHTWINLAPFLNYTRQVRPELAVSVKPCFFDAVLSNRVWTCMFTPRNISDRCPEGDIDLICTTPDFWDNVISADHALWLSDGSGFFHYDSLSLDQPQRLLTPDDAFLLESTAVPALVRKDSVFLINAIVTNKSGWDFDNICSFENPISFSYRWLDIEGNPVEGVERLRTSFDRLSDGQSAEVAIKVLSPEIPGTYILETLLMQESVGWFTGVDAAQTAVKVMP